MEAEKWEPLGDGFGVFTSPSFRFSGDSLLLADFSLQVAPPGGLAADLGAGCGIVAMLLAKAGTFAAIHAVEIQEEACRLIEQSAAQSGEMQTVHACHADLRALRGLLPGNRFDLVVCNPPYKQAGAGAASPHPARRLARQEEGCRFAEITQAAARLLRFGGSFCLCQRPERLCGVFEALCACGLEPKLLRVVQQRPGSEPSLLLIQARKGGKPGLRMLPTLVIENPQNPGPTATK